MAERETVITYWHLREDDLPEVAPGAEYEGRVVPQKFVVLRRILVHDVVLVHLRIGAADDVPFELESEDGALRTYKPRGLDDAALRKRIVATGAAVATADSIAIPPGMEVRLILRNEGAVPVKPRSALLVHEEGP